MRWGSNQSPPSPILSPAMAPWIGTPWLMIATPPSNHRRPEERKSFQLKNTQTSSPFQINIGSLSSQHWLNVVDINVTDGWSKAKDRDCGGWSSSADTCFHCAPCLQWWPVLGGCRVVMENTKELIELCSQAPPPVSAMPSLTRTKTFKALCYSTAVGCENSQSRAITVTVVYCSSCRLSLSITNSAGQWQCGQWDSPPFQLHDINTLSQYNTVTSPIPLD